MPMASSGSLRDAPESVSASPAASSPPVNSRVANTASPDLEGPQLYLNRELSLLEFQGRVLEEAQDPTNPLLERMKFLSILSSNVDWCFMVRVAGSTNRRPR